MDYTRDFYYGTKGADVRMFQTNLMTLGYDLPKYGADGVYGKETEGATKKCCQDKHWDYCSWGIEGGKPPCPIWCQEHVHAAAHVKPEPGGWMPEGRGMWIQSMNTCSPEEAEVVTREVGLKFVIIQAHWQYRDKGSTIYNWPDDLGLGLKKSYGCTTSAKRAIEKFRELGVQVLPFSYPVPNKHQEVIDALAAYAEAWESPSVVIDPEAEWKSSSGKYKDEAVQLSNMLTAQFPSWGMSSYGAPWYHRSFPFAEFSTAVYGLPQTYGVTTFGTNEQMQRAHNEWLAYGFPYQVQLYGTYGKTDAEMRQILTVCAAMDPFATAGWKWGTTSDVEWGHIDAILPE